MFRATTFVRFKNGNERLDPAAKRSIQQEQRRKEGILALFSSPEPQFTPEQLEILDSRLPKEAALANDRNIPARMRFEEERRQEQFDPQVQLEKKVTSGWKSFMSYLRGTKL
eukprot:TRINITY_DN1365_c0_g1_i1.p1 TRINITY_DN1365_c0_g1~~TRINITY_DN1365_c0_g1_i1.p1  ORF type:complete len:112 (-),score=31.25 TRINITY_DN1365_c0_g1_i1:57-392(-)